MKLFKRLFIIILLILLSDGWASVNTKILDNINEETISSKFLSQMPHDIINLIFTNINPWEIKGLLLTSKNINTFFGDEKEIWSLWIEKWGFNIKNCSSPASFMKGRIFCRNFLIATFQAGTSLNQTNSNNKAQEFLQKAINFGDTEARYIKRSQLLNNNQFDEAHEINEALCRDKYSKAIETKIDDLKTQKISCLYEQNFDSLKLYIEKIWILQNPLALITKIEGFTYGYWGYVKNPSKAVEIIEEEIKKKNFRAFLLKVEGLTKSKYGYSKNLFAAKLFIEENEKLKNSLFLRCYIEGLYEGNYGYEKDKNLAKTTLDHQLQERNIDAFMLIFEALGGGLYGYKIDHNYRKMIINDFANENVSSAISKKIEGLYKGKYGYTKDNAEAVSFLKKHNPLFLNIADIYETI